MNLAASDTSARAWIAVSARAGISVLFLYAGVVKILDVETFARSILGYDLAPEAWIVPLALVLPWLEVWSVAVLWLAPPFRRAGWWMILGMLAVFTLAKISAVARGLDISCGCTGSTDPMTWMDVWMNVFWLIVAGIGLIFDRRGFRTLSRLVSA